MKIGLHYNLIQVTGALLRYQELCNRLFFAMQLSRLVEEGFLNLNEEC